MRYITLVKRLFGLKSGMNNIKISNKNWVLEVSLGGGRVVDLRCKDRKILGSFNRIDGKTGNTHLCVPNFANEGVELYGLPFHGPSRNEEWEVVKQTENSLVIACEIREVGNYPGNIYLKQELELNEEFSQKVLIKNIGIKKAPVNLGIHNYFYSENDWRGVMVNGVDVGTIVEISDYIELKEENLVSIPGKSEIIWKTYGFNFAKLWTGFKEENGVKTFDKEYVCIEPVRGKEGLVEKPESIISEGEELVFEQRILLEK